MFDEVIIDKSPVLGDDRGFFFPLPIGQPWLQCNTSLSKKNTFRGLHHQRGEFAQTKKIHVIQGRIIDFVVDLRKDTLGNTLFVYMNPGDTILVPKYCAHGFLALEDDTLIQYLVDAPYNAEADTSFLWSANEIVKNEILKNVTDELDLYISNKDKQAIILTQDYSIK